ncbi:MAG: transcriptional regulator MraZ [Desulforudis sp.]|nr:division/cell wall cluster transcriptional repressor MraZ [Clostridia bacterium]MDQ7791468.1 division/cell wall cluster transcriptional repressor MraZ [Clostridia bacterium]RJX16775.1 MAG: transcriptional regulator MraZ [Desulforudis sp.]
MFIGEYQHTMDNKGRLFIPARFREGLGDHFVVTKGLDRCLFAYSVEEWAQLETKLKKLPFAKADARAFVRLFFSGAAELESDKQGRIVVPSNLRQYAGLDKDVVVLGVSSRVEIWAKDEWERYSLQAGGNYEEIAEKIVDFDLDL